MSADTTSPTDDAISFPRQSARTQRFTLGEPRNVVVSPDGRAHRVPAQPRRHRPGQLPVGRRRGDRRGAPRRRSRACCSAGATTTTCRPRSGPAASGRARRPAASPRSPPTPPSPSPRSPSPAGCSSAACSAARPASSPSPGRCSTPGPTRRPQRVAYVSGRAAVHRRARRHAGGVLAGGEPTSRRRSPGAAPSSSPPRRWTASAATGGARTATALAVARVDTAPVQRWYIADPADPARRPRELRLPGGRHAPTPTSRCTSRPRRRRSSTSSGTATAFPYLADVHWSDGRPDRRPCSRATSARSRCSRSTRPPARRRCCSTTTTTPGSSSCPACPGCSPDGALVTCADRDGARRLLVDGEPVTPPDLQVRAVADRRRRR